MAVYKIFPEKDASLYSAYPAMNTGLDAILDVSNLVVNRDPTSQVARSLVKFDNDQIIDVVNNVMKVTGSAAWDTWDSRLRLYVAKATNMIIDTKVYVYAVSSSWNNGSGQYLDKLQNFSGVSWKFEDFSGSADVWPVAGWSPRSTGSYDPTWSNAKALATGSGGSWYTGSGGYQRPTGTEINISESYQQYTLRSSKDFDVDVSDIVTMWYSASAVGVDRAGLDVFNNDGFILKQELEFTNLRAQSPQLSFYSVDTNTIYPPQLEFRWVDFTYATSSGDFKDGRTLTASAPPNYTNATLTSSISCSFTESLPAPTMNGSGATFGATFNSSSMVNIFVKELGLGYKAGDVLTWSFTSLNTALAGKVSGFTTDATVTLSTHDIQQLDVINTPDIYCALDNNAGVFYSESINQFRLNVRPEFPARTFVTSSLDTKQHALTTSSYYAIKDLDTNEFVVEFDKKYTQISCDATSSFFTVYMNGLEPERYYNILIQTEVAGNTVVLDENYYFKVVNG